MILKCGEKITIAIVISNLKLSHPKAATVSCHTVFAGLVVVP